MSARYSSGVKSTVGLRMLKPTLLTRMSRESPNRARRVGDEGGALRGIGHVARGAGDAEAAGAPLGDRGVDVGGRARADVHGRAVGREGLDDGAAGRRKAMVAVVSDVALSRAVVTIEDGTGELRDAGARGRERTRDLSCRRSRRLSCRRGGRAWSWRSSRARRGMMARRRPPRRKRREQVSPSGLKWMEKWIFFC